MGQLRDLKIEYKQTHKNLFGKIIKQELLLDAIDKEDPQYQLEEQKLKLLKEMADDVNYSLQWIKLGHAPGDYNGIYNKRVGEGD